MTPVEIKRITSDLMYKWAVIFFLCYIPFRFWAKSITLKKVKALLQKGEEILCEVGIAYYIELMLPLCFGGVFGWAILPFFLYPDILQLDRIQIVYGFGILPITRWSLPILIAIEIVAVLIILLLACRRCVVTNKRIITVYCFDFLGKFYKIPTSFNHTDIKSIELVNNYSADTLNLTLNNGTLTYLVEANEYWKTKY